jgi:hypothetical protein
MLAVAGNLATKKIAPPSLGTFPVNSTLFTVLLVGVIRDRRRADLLPGAQPRADPRTPTAAFGHQLCVSQRVSKFATEMNFEVG